MWALAVIGAMMLLAAFTGFGVVALLSLPVLVAALVFNILEDRKLDKIAAGMVHGADAGIRR